MENKCIFCMINRGELPAYFIYRDQYISIFLDIMPVDKGHMLITPIEHYESLHDTPPYITAKMFAAAAALVRILRKKLGAPGVNVITNSGRAAGQEIFHTHIHVIPRWRGGGWKQLTIRHRLTEEEAQKVVSSIKPYTSIIDDYLKTIECGE